MLFFLCLYHPKYVNVNRSYKNNILFTFAIVNTMSRQATPHGISEYSCQRFHMSSGEKVSKSEQNVFMQISNSINVAPTRLACTCLSYK